MATNSFEKVAQADAKFREEGQERIETFAPAAEAAALRAIFSDAALMTTCASVLGQRWQATQDKWDGGGWAGAPDEQLGTAIQTVVTELDAAHLLPSGIRERLQEGTSAACYGLPTLLGHFPERPQGDG